jgi:hypothetical protein
VLFDRIRHNREMFVNALEFFSGLMRRRDGAKSR